MGNIIEKLDRYTDGSSLNIVQDNIEKLKTLFPDLFAEGKIDFDKLRETLGATLETQEERYNFTWHGKAQARRIAQTPSTGTLRPCKAESKHWDTTQNLFIEGDNLEVLKLLQKSYHKRVKVIYIDPPYNTGKEFIYPDNYQDNLDTYLKYTGQKDTEGRKFGTNAETSGRYHTNWLNMMYPRLKLARNLLRDDGVIFISIDDNEVSNLRKLCDEIFGEENFYCSFVWKRRSGAMDSVDNVSADHEYVLCYGRAKINLNGVARTFERYSNPDNDHRGDWIADNLSAGKPGGNTFYAIKDPETGNEFWPPKGRYWPYSPETMQQKIAENRIIFPKNASGSPLIKRFKNEAKSLFVPISTWGADKNSSVSNAFITSLNTEGTKELKSIFENKVFTFPKPVQTIKSLIKQAEDDGCLVLDFFSGSCTSAHAVMELNAQDNGNRKYIMVQLPEACDEQSEAYKANYKTIADIGKERIRRAGEKIKADNIGKKGIENLDIGFKVFKLDSSNIKPWDADFDNLEDTLLNAVDNIKDDRSEDDVLFEVLLKYGLDLTVPIEERNIAGKTVYAIGFGALVICLDDAIPLDVVEGIGQLKENMAPEVMRVVFKDSGFKDDVVKTNAIQILKKYNIIDVKSL